MTLLVVLFVKKRPLRGRTDQDTDGQGRTDGQDKIVDGLSDPSLLYSATLSFSTAAMAVTAPAQAVREPEQTGWFSSFKLYPPSLIL